MILLIVSLLLGWLGPLTTVSAALGQAQLASAYDNLLFPVVSSHTATERGSPSTKRPSKTYDAVNARSRGAATRTVAAAPPAPPIYDDLVGHAHDPRVASTTHERRARGDSRVSWATALSGVAANTAAVDEAASAAQGARLREHLRLSEQYGAGGMRELPDGRLRYYGEVTAASTPGEMAGARLVREWGPATGNYRTWYETLDHAGRIRQVHPYQPYSSHHYTFDQFGNYGGRR